MLLAQPGLALQRGQPTALNTPCGRRALLPIAQVVRKGDPGLNPPEIWRMSVKNFDRRDKGLIFSRAKLRA